MRLNNHHKIGFFNFLSTLLVMISLLGLLAFLLDWYGYHHFGKGAVFFLLVPLVLVVIFYLRGRQVFEYDSDGEALSFKNKNVLFFLEQPLSDEFPKYKMQNFEILNAVIFKRLYITVASKKYQSVTLRYDISYLTKKELNDLKFSLQKVIKTNKETDNS